MNKHLPVIYENGVFRPLQPVTLPEHHHATVLLPDGEEEWLDTSFMDRCAQEVQGEVSLEHVRQALASIPGSLADDLLAERDES
jgi:predicted DNA-binding antitoxin AbrB/MazE fold protein